MRLSIMEDQKQRSRLLEVFFGKKEERRMKRISIFA
jgi:hypothetical protein